jgi:hypothetical protein
MKHAKKMYFLPDGYKDSKSSILDEFEQEITSIFNNKALSSAERKVEFKKVITKYEYIHFNQAQNNTINENAEFSQKNEARVPDVRFKLQDASRKPEDNHASSSSLAQKRNEYHSLAIASE